MENVVTALVTVLCIKNDELHNMNVKQQPQTTVVDGYVVVLPELQNPLDYLSTLFMLAEIEHQMPIFKQGDRRERQTKTLDIQ
jgi:hypothetical protein